MGWRPSVGKRVCNVYAEYISEHSSAQWAGGVISIQKTSPGARAFPVEEGGISGRKERASLNCKAWLCSGEYNTSGDSAHTHSGQRLLRLRETVGGLQRNTEGRRGGQMNRKDRRAKRDKGEGRV